MQQQVTCFAFYVALFNCFQNFLDLAASVSLCVSLCLSLTLCVCVDEWWANLASLATIVALSSHELMACVLKTSFDVELRYGTLTRVSVSTVKLSRVLFPPFFVM